MKRSKRAYWVLGVALLALLAVVVYVFVVSNGEDSDEEGHPALLDETGQSPRIHSAETTMDADKDKPTHESEISEESEIQEPAEESPTTGGSDLDALNAAWAYDLEGGKGKPPAAWKADYSHWDNSTAWIDPIEIVGLLQRHPITILVNRRTEEDTKRMDEIGKELGNAVLKGLASPVPLPDYVHRIPEDGKNAYIAPSFLERYDALTQEIAEIDKRSMKEEPGFNYTGPASLLYDDSDFFKIEYYRRRSDGSLMREVTLSNGTAQRWVAAPPADLSDYSEEEIELMMKTDWRD